MISGYFGIGQNQAFNCPSASREASVVVAGAALALMGRKATAPTVKQLVRAAQWLTTGCSIDWNCKLLRTQLDELSSVVESLRGRNNRPQLELFGKLADFLIILILHQKDKTAHQPQKLQRHAVGCGSAKLSCKMSLQHFFTGNTVGKTSSTANPRMFCGKIPWRLSRCDKHIT